MRKCTASLLAMAVLGGSLLSAAPAKAALPEGTWIVADRVALETFDCGGLLCGKVVWLRNPALRTPQMCARTIVWGLKANGSTQWEGGWFFDPEDGATYNVSASLQAPDMIAAHIYKGISLFGKTEILRRIPSRSLPGWC